MEIIVAEQSGVKVVRVRGNLDGENSHEFLETLTNLFTGAGVRIVIDLSGVPFLNSTGLGDLVRVNAQANTQEARVILAAPQPFVEGVFATTQLNRFFEICPTVDQALARLK